MNRQTIRLRRAARRGLFIMRSRDHATGYDVVDACGPCGLRLTKRTAINQAVHASSQKTKARIYGTDSSGMWHRHNCCVVASATVISKPCKCKYLVV